MNGEFLVLRVQQTPDPAGEPGAPGEKGERGPPCPKGDEGPVSPKRDQGLLSLVLLVPKGLLV